MKAKMGNTDHLDNIIKFKCEHNTEPKRMESFKVLALGDLSGLPIDEACFFKFLLYKVSGFILET